MSVIERINMLKKMVKEVELIVVWQETIYTALHNIHADWIVSGTIAWARLAANFPKTIATLLSDHNLAHHVLGVIVPHDALANLTEKAHGSLTGVTSDQHHPQAHTLASHSTKAHGELTGVTSGQHHPQAHTLASHSTKAHTELTGVTANQHHTKYVHPTTGTCPQAPKAHESTHVAGGSDDIDSALAIAAMANLASGKVWQGDVSNRPTEVDVPTGV
ncbi:unnamed protein product, partial [marine sediment metagenome]